jgi:hypothetical protein
MLKIVKYFLTIQALINVGTINNNVPTNTFDKVMNFICYTFSSFYIFIEVNNFLKLNESNIVGLLFIDKFDYLLLKVLTTAVSNFMELYKGNQGVVRVLTNITLFTMYENKNVFFSLMIANIVFTEIVVPIIKIFYNSIFLGKEIYQLRSEKERLINGVYYLIVMYFAVVVIITQKNMVV